MKEININEIEDFKIGNAEDVEGATGVTVIICEEGAAAGVDVRGGGPATRETDLLRPENMVKAINAVVLSGGSAYGLEAGSGVMNYLEERDIGFDTGISKVPIVSGASLFDLGLKSSKKRPDKKMGYDAAKNAFLGNFKEGCHGAGTGATVGKYRGPERMMKSGIGASAVSVGDLKVGAVSAVNALGDIFDLEGRRIAGLLSEDGKCLASTEDEIKKDILKEFDVFKGNTTISCLITNGKLTKAECNKLASTLHDAYARTIRPVHTSADGDTIFVMASCKVEVNFDAFTVLAREELEKAIIRGPLSAKEGFGLKCAKDLK